MLQENTAYSANPLVSLLKFFDFSCQFFVAVCECFGVFKSLDLVFELADPDVGNLELFLKGRYRLW